MVFCGPGRAADRIPVPAAMKAVQEYGHDHKPASADPKYAIAIDHAITVRTFSVPDPSLDVDGSYQAHIGMIFGTGDFPQLEMEAREIRGNQARLKGGVWKLYGFYEGVSTPNGGTGASASDWIAHFAALQKWIQAFPDSATARIALANAYINYAWRARGTGSADSVHDLAWELFAHRIDLAEASLMDAAQMRDKCPYWYEAMQKVALAQGWPKQDARELFDNAVAFEPKYYHFYREYANFLQPKWYGEEGEARAFAEESGARLGEPDGPIVYFEITSLLVCHCGKEGDSLTGMSWPLIKRGYDDLQRLYGTSDLKINRFAYMAYLAGDKASARAAFGALGSKVNLTVWRNYDTFKSAEAWAMAQ
jgi:hypothetical protein